MINLRSIANQITRKINPNINGVVMISDGYEISEGFRQVPRYRHVFVSLQVQALSPGDLAHIAGMTLQGITRSVYANGNFYGPSRPSEKGGDLVRFQGKNWKIVVPVEIWPSWCHFIVNMQIP